ncbi:FUSC family protein [Methylobacterium sp. NEAU 140]|uniref:FUSC family protein n=1 Tax=Methylobacterium sp. NEAU 140 TaxID=3064945 RepID=UPI002734847B|nr:FUSC family protein [Methylobacterium sp. NEAU 140]MDP4025932.1 FUSC family protein [Methylobacterium sp. NEAU 140]
MTASFAGLPLSRWLFALRIWLAVHLALGVAFWIQLDGASSAGVTAAILALQTRGQIIEKSAYRFLGTAVGGVVSIVIVGLFAQARDLYVIAYSAWLAACVFAAGFLDGNRAYGAVICGYTVSIVAVFQMDDPGGLFSAILNRCAAIAIGIASITLVVDLFSGPEIGPGLLDRIGRGREAVRAFADGLLRDGPGAGTDARAAAMLRTVSDQHPLLNALPVEAVSGTARAGAVRAALAAFVGEIRAARALAVSRHGRGGDPRLRALIERRLTGELAARREAAAQAYAAARAGRPVPHPPRMPIYRPRENALRNALRAFLASVASGFLFVLTGWPMTSVAWGMVGVVMCLSANAPDPAVMSRSAVIAVPAAVVAGGITQFLILGGVDAFPLLMLGTAPALFASLLLTSSPVPTRAGIGLLVTVFTLAIVGPSNPQSYDPQTYVTDAILFVTAALLVFVLVRVLFPTTGAQRRRWALDAARRDMRDALRGAGRARPDGETRLLDASRIGTLAALPGTGPADLAAALRMADLARAARRVRRGLDRLAPPGPGGTAPDLDRRARAALAAADADGLRRAADALLAAGDDADRLALAADMAWAADLIDAPAEPATEAVR